MSTKYEVVRHIGILDPLQLTPAEYPPHRTFNKRVCSLLEQEHTVVSSAPSVHCLVEDSLNLTLLPLPLREQLGTTHFTCFCLE